MNHFYFPTEAEEKEGTCERGKEGGSGRASTSANST